MQGTAWSPTAKLTRSYAAGGSTTRYRTGSPGPPHVPWAGAGFSGLHRTPLRSQTIPILASDAWVGQLVASDTRANRSVSITIDSQRLGSSVFICPAGGITLIVTVLEKRNQSPGGVRVQSGEPLPGSRAFERRTVPLMTMLNVALCRSCEAVVRKPRRLSYTPDLEMLQR
jgi:hypothetical protein